MKKNYLKFDVISFISKLHQVFENQKAVWGNKPNLKNEETIYGAIKVKEIRSEDGSEVAAGANVLLHNFRAGEDTYFLVIPVTIKDSNYVINIKSQLVDKVSSGKEVRGVKEVLQDFFQLVNIPYDYNKGKTCITIISEEHWISSLKAVLKDYIAGSLDKSDACSLVAEYVGYNEKAFELIDSLLPKVQVPGKLLLTQYWDGESEAESVYVKPTGDQASADI